MSKSQLQAFVIRMEADPALRAQVEAASDDAAAVVALALSEGHTFSPATWTRHLRG
jgi:predicted ribosomally synthesized peptide with nif11-like leader